MRQSGKTIEAYQQTYVTSEEKREELAIYWDKKIYKGTKTPLGEAQDR